jgi:hypothetical protein
MDVALSLKIWHFDQNILSVIADFSAKNNLVV